MISIVAFVGKAGSGKDYQCNLLVQNKGFEKVSFAEPIREIAARILNINYEEFLANYDNIKKREVFPECTGRLLMENIGASIRKIKPNFFVEALWDKLNSQKYRNKNICISDMRFIEEYEFFNNLANFKGMFNFKTIFCDYRSERYEATNTAPSTKFPAALQAMGYTDLQEVKEEDVLKIKEILNG